MAYRCLSCFACGIDFLIGSDTFRSVCICIYICVSTHHSFSNEFVLALYKFWSPGGTLIPWFELCCPYFQTIELHSKTSLGITPSSITNFLTQNALLSVVIITIHPSFVESITVSNLGTHPKPAHCATF